MKIRDGFVTNSSSTNFLIISKEELTSDYLIEKLGFSPQSRIMSAANDLAEDILGGIRSGLRWFDIDEINYESVLEVFGEESAKKYEKLVKQGYYTYMGHTNSDDTFLTAFMTMDSFVIDQNGFYMNGQNCVW